MSKNKERREFRRETIAVEGAGTYVLVYQRPGEDPIADLNFFDGDRSASDLPKMAEALAKAERLMAKWKSEG